MKRVISAAIFLAILSTPAFANKTQVQTCNDHKLETQIVYHLDQIEMLLKEMRKNNASVLSQPEYTDKKSE
jgi:hypothetical protein